nr:2,3-bisphosphoglycerate-independent phosphoglycerate mutase [Mycoplasmopsis iners]
MKKVVLIVIDGLGLRAEEQGNAFKLAKTPTFDDLFANYPNSVIGASGEDVGLPKGQMGNSEVGHLNIGAGRIVYTGLSLINQAIKTGEFNQNNIFIDVLENVKNNNSTLHLMGLLSPGGVHSEEKHLFELLKLAHEKGVKNVAVHIFGDGRDVAPKSILSSIEKLQKLCDEYGYKIASIGGRFYGMDRDKMFDRVEQHYNAIIGKSSQTFDNAYDYVQKQYEQGIADEFLIPAINPSAKFVKDNDSIIFFNFRPDRARQLTHLFIGSDLYDFEPENKVKIADFVSMMKYEGLNTKIAFEEMKVINPIGKVLENNNLKQLRLAETQKYAHVTFFMDGGNDIEYKNSGRIMVPSLKVQSYADAPEMSAKEIVDELVAKGLDYDVTIMNFANPDMVGHTGNLKSTIKAIEFLDSQIKRLLEWAKENDVTVFITADHGNAEITEDANGNPATKHTSSPVMLISTDKQLILKDGILANIAPTILDYMGLQRPNEMTHESLIVDWKDDTIKLKTRPCLLAKPDVIDLVLKSLEEGNLTVPDNFLAFSLYLENKENETPTNYIYNLNRSIKWVLRDLKSSSINPNFVMLFGDEQYSENLIKEFNFTYAPESLSKEKIAYYKMHTSRLEQGGLFEAINDYLYRIKNELLRQETEDRIERQRVKEKLREQYRSGIFADESNDDDDFDDDRYDEE